MCSARNVIHQQHRVFFEVKVFYFDVFRFHSFLRLDSNQQNPTLVLIYLFNIEISKRLILPC